ncbi:MAG: hypothetical protein H3C68_01745 [Deltaproteobacteria bacterium]|nr:hypothetical protein [Deltaproteobacteria bacterium]MBZ0219023.1 hypothetical protein [Deltaproteobacteria bacterium]
MVLLTLLTLAALVLNLPFGYFRVKTKKFSVKWFLYIHLPIPFIFLLRTMAGLGYKFIPLMIIGAVAGQLIGGKLNRKGA